MLTYLTYLCPHSVVCIVCCGPPHLHWKLISILLPHSYTWQIDKIGKRNRVHRHIPWHITKNHGCIRRVLPYAINAEKEESETCISCHFYQQYAYIPFCLSTVLWRTSYRLSNIFFAAFSIRAGSTKKYHFIPSWHTFVTSSTRINAR